MASWRSGLYPPLMSGILECEGIFQVPIPDGWTVTGEPGRAYDLSHATQDVGVNISVYPLAAVGSDMEAAVHKFAVSTGAGSEVEVVVTNDDKRQRRAFARFDADDRTWLVAFLFLRDAAVLVTSNCRAGDAEAFSHGEVVVASLGPVAAKRGLFRRR